MFGSESLSDKIKNNERRLKELLRVSESQDREYKELIKDWGIEGEDIDAFAENPDNYSPEEWDELKKDSNEFFAYVNQELNKIQDTSKTQRTLAEKGRVKNNWIFVR